VRVAKNLELMNYWERKYKMKNFDDRLIAILSDVFDAGANEVAWMEGRGNLKEAPQTGVESITDAKHQIKAEIASQMEPLIKEWMLELVQPDVEADPDMQGNATAKTNRTRNQMKREIRQRINNITLKDCAEALQLEGKKE
jgi:hypothetical protein